MSFSRFGHDCDVYTYEHVDGHFECAGCIIYGHLHPNTMFLNRTDLAAHMREHERVGHKVPEYVIANILHDERCVICGAIGKEPCTPSCDDDGVADEDVERRR